MLTPRYLESAPDAMIALYSEVEVDILADMARRIAKYDFFIPAAEHQLRVLEEMGAEQAYILRCLAELTGRSEEELRQLFEAAGGKALVSDQGDYRRAGLHPPALNTSQELQQVLSAGLRQTNGLFTNLTRTTALDSGERFRAVLDRAWLQVSTGGFDANTAIRNAIKELTRQGLTTVDYASGRTLSVEAAVRMNVVTGINQTALRLQDIAATGNVGQWLGFTFVEANGATGSIKYYDHTGAQKTVDMSKVQYVMYYRHHTGQVRGADQRGTLLRQAGKQALCLALQRGTGQENPHRRGKDLLLRKHLRRKRGEIRRMDAKGYCSRPVLRRQHQGATDSIQHPLDWGAHLWHCGHHGRQADLYPWIVCIGGITYGQPEHRREGGASVY